MTTIQELETKLQANIQRKEDEIATIEAMRLDIFNKEQVIMAIDIENQEISEQINALKSESADKLEEAEIKEESLIEIVNQKTTDEEKSQLIDIYPTWEELIGKSLTANKYFSYNGGLYRTVQNVTAQEIYPPSVDTLALYTQVGVKDEETGLEELFPSSVNTYEKGMIGQSGGRVYESLWPNNGNPVADSGWWKDLGTVEEYLSKTI